MRFHRRFARLLRLVHAKEKPYLATFTLPLGHRAGSLDVSQFSGLIATHVSVDATAPTLFAYWKSQEDFVRGGGELRKAAGATAEIEARHLIHYREATRSIWKRMPWYTVLATVLAIVGGVSAFRSEYQNLRMPPQIEPLPRPGAINYLVGEPIDEPLYLTNYLPVAQRVAVKSVELTNGDRFLDARVIPIPSVFRLSENGTGEMRLRTTTARPGRYEIRGSLNVRAGYFGGKLDAPFAVPIRAWSADPMLDGELRIKRTDANDAQLEGDLLLGTPAKDGITCRITINRHPELTAVYVRSHKTKTLEEWTPDNKSRGAETGSAMFLFEEVEPMKPQHFFIELESQTPTDWKKVRADIKVTLFRHGKEDAR